MAQHAKPKSMYHCDEARPQLRRSSTFVVNTFSGNWFSSDVKASFDTQRMVMPAGPRYVSESLIPERGGRSPLSIDLTLRQYAALEMGTYAAI
jgi:hypothetical protein